MYIYIIYRWQQWHDPQQCPWARVLTASLQAEVLHQQKAREKCVKTCDECVKKAQKMMNISKKNKVLMKKTCEFFKSLGRNLSKTSFHWRFCAQQRKARLQSFEGEGLHNSQRHSGLLNRLNKLNLERNEPSEPTKKSKKHSFIFLSMKYWNTAY